MTDSLANLSEIELRNRLQAHRSAHHQLSDEQDKYIRQNPSPSRAWQSERYEELQDAMARHNKEILAIDDELRRRAS